METVEYKIEINALRESVWEKLWDKESHANWTQHFEPKFYIKSDWEVGGKTYFLEDENHGMVSTITSLDQPSELIFGHLGTFIDGVEDTYSAEVVEWSGNEEKYFLRDVEPEMTELRVIIHIYKYQRAKMDAGFHKGLQILKDLCETSDDELITLF